MFFFICFFQTLLSHCQNCIATDSVVTLPIAPTKSKYSVLNYLVYKLMRKIILLSYNIKQCDRKNITNNT